MTDEKKEPYADWPDCEQPGCEGKRQVSVAEGVEQSICLTCGDGFSKRVENHPRWATGQVMVGGVPLAAPHDAAITFDGRE